MKILFAIQGTGNGHLSRAEDIYPELCKYGDVDVLVSGIQADIKVSFPIKYRLYGCSFIFGSKGGIDLWQTFKKLRPIRFVRDMYKLKVHHYDWVISDFEPVSVWACKLQKKKIYGLSHQSAVAHPMSSKPKKIVDPIGTFILNYYAPCDKSVGFYIQAIPPNIFPAVIRSSVRNLEVTSGNTIVVYLPSYKSQTIVNILSQITEANWMVFSKNEVNSWVQANVTIEPVNNDRFIKALASCQGVLMGAGFEGPCEAIALGKKIMVVPMKGQYEQQCNAAALASIGIQVIPKLTSKFIPNIKAWVNQDQHQIETVHFPTDTAEQAVQRLYELRMEE